MALMNGSNGSGVLVLIDYENVFIEFGKKISKQEPINWKGVLEAAESYGGPVISKAYADWSGNRARQDILSELGIQPVMVASKKIGKNGVDVKIAVDALDMLIVKDINIGSLVLVSGDGDFTPLVHYLKDSGKYVVGIGIRGATAEYLASACHEFKYLVTNSELVDANQKTFKDLKETQPVVVELQPVVVEPQPAVVEPQQPAVVEPQPAVVEPQPAVAEADRGAEEQKALAPEARETGNRPEEVVKKYLEILHKNKILIEPTESRPFIIKKAFWKVKKYAGRPLVEIKEKISSYFERKHAGIDKGHVTEIFHQMVKADCFHFGNASGDSAKPLPVWERTVYLKKSIVEPRALMRVLDKFLIGIISRETSPEEINCKALSTVLHGTSQKPELVHRAKQLVGKTDQRLPN